MLDRSLESVKAAEHAHDVISDGHQQNGEGQHGAVLLTNFAISPISEETQGDADYAQIQDVLNPLREGIVVLQQSFGARSIADERIGFTHRYDNHPKSLSVGLQITAPDLVAEYSSFNIDLMSARQHGNAAMLSGNLGRYYEFKREGKWWALIRKMII